MGEGKEGREREREEERGRVGEVDCVRQYEPRTCEEVMLYRRLTKTQTQSRRDEERMKCDADQCTADTE
jgi:hypothetical protein